MISLAVLANNASKSQLSYDVITQLNLALQTHPLSPLLFYEDVSLPYVRPAFSIMGISELWGFEGIGIATDLSTCAKLNSVPGNVQKYFYVWDLEWLNRPRLAFNYNELYDIYNYMPLIARSKIHADILVNNWSAKVIGIMPEFNFNSLKEIINV